MALFNKADLLVKYRMKHEYAEGEIQKTSAEKLLKSMSKEASFADKFDIFLSHSYDDARVIVAFKETIENMGYSVYVDWIIDPNLSRYNVTKLNAMLIRIRMERCKCLFYATSDSATKSVWMPWELGYMDAQTKKVAIVPIVEEEADSNEYRGREYLGLYSYVSKSKDELYIHKSKEDFAKFDIWLNNKGKYFH